MTRTLKPKAGTSGSPRRLAGLGVLAVGVLAGCAPVTTVQMAPDEAPVVMGAAVRGNRTPIDGAFSCLADQVRLQRRPRIAIAVGDVKDYTGKYSQNDGSAITQGGALMVYSALGKMGRAIQLQERFDTRIAELELAYIDRRQLGDGTDHLLQTPQGQEAVPWVPYFGGTILRSDYYIVGGITELNYNIQSGGAQIMIAGVGPKARSFTMSIGVDLRIIDTKTLEVIDTASLQKQITGYEVGIDVFRFFGSNLYDINMGAKNMEPLQLGVRYALEQGVLDLVGTVTGVDSRPCLDQALQVNGMGVAPVAAADTADETAPADVADDAAESVSVADEPEDMIEETETVSVAETPRVQPLSIDKATNAGPSLGEHSYQVAYEFGDPALARQSESTIERIVADAAANKSVEVQIIARDNESWSPVKRKELTDQRIRNLRDALAARGVHPARVRTTWEPASSDTGIRRDGAGYQIFAVVAVTPE
ncbi:MAG: CsgG/HfaB family protein [Castellaniella sp.]